MADSPDNSGAAGNTDRITAPVQVTTLLRRVMENRDLLTVRIPGNEQPFLTAILEVSADGFLLDELKPEKGHELLQRAGKLHINAEHRGVELRFDATLVAAGREGGVAFYRMALPELVHYLQRRGTLRVRVSMVQKLLVAIPLPDNKVLEGQLFDISAGGLGMQFDNYKEQHTFQVGDMLSDCQLALSPRETVGINLEIRFVHLDPERKRLRLGARFVDLPRNVENKVVQVVTTIDRERRRKMLKD